MASLLRALLRLTIVLAIAAVCVAGPALIVTLIMGGGDGMWFAASASALLTVLVLLSLENVTKDS